MRLKKVLRFCCATRTPLVVVVASLVVYCGTPITVFADEAASPVPKTSATQQHSTVEASVQLPNNVVEMRDMILAAVQSGRIEDLEPAVALNELPPEFGSDATGGPMAELRALSIDGSGRDLLAVLGNLLASDPVPLPIGRDTENNIVFVWPGLSERNLDQLTAAEEVALLRLMPQAGATAMKKEKKWTWWRLAIGADGTWLTFMKPAASK
jgi:hypothetical protein